MGGGSAPEGTEPFAVEGYTGWIVPRRRPADDAELLRLLDPGSAAETLHWGRNYIYRTELATAEGRLAVAVKQFPGGGRRRRLRRRLSGSKAAKSFRVARALLDAGLATPEPVLVAESESSAGATYYVCRHLAGVVEARYLVRAANAGEAARRFPEIDLDGFLDALGRTVRRLHEAGVWHRDLTSGNVLIEQVERGGEEGRGGLGEGARSGDDGGGPPGDEGPFRLHLVDLNRARLGRRPTLSERCRDLSRMPLFRPEHQERYLTAYWGGAVPPGARRLYLFYHRSFLRKNETKRRLRRVRDRIKSWLVPRGVHAHIPEAPAEADRRDRVVWDHLSDQPHQHAGRLDKLAVRLADLGTHATQARALFAALPRVRRRYGELTAELYTRPVLFDGIGLALRPLPGEGGLETVLGEVEELGVENVSIRLHPWEDDHDDEEALARELAARGLDVAFALPQNRELVRDPARWRASVEELAERFLPYGKAFQVGQAINRSKWGVWNAREYAELAAVASDVLRGRDPEVRILGPAVIDFEVHVTAGVVNSSLLGERGVRFDALASLLYVDRRGAPENRQLGFSTVEKVTLLQAIADTARHCEGRSWITEVNWPLWEGPHSPAGKSVSVDEETQAAYLERFYLLALATGYVERVYWWQLVARGYGLAAMEEGSGEAGGRPRLRRRPSWYALQRLVREVGGAELVGVSAEAGGLRRYRFRRGDETIEVAWEAEGGRGPRYGGTDGNGELSE